MPYTDLQQLSAAEFKSLCGATCETFGASSRGGAIASGSQGAEEDKIN